MTSGTPVTLREPLAALVPRAARSVRRTMHIDIGPRRGFSASLDMSGVARDLRTGPAGPDDVTVLAEASVAAGFDTGRNLITLETTPPAPWTDDLIGARAGGGFRRHLDQVVPGAEAGSLLRQVLDDMPAAALISGYAWLRLARREGHDPGTLVPADLLARMSDLCSGWRQAARPWPVSKRPTACPSRTARRRPPPNPTPGPGTTSGPSTGTGCAAGAVSTSAVDGAGNFSIWAMFRDTVGEEDGAEVVLHEYAVTASGAGDRVGAVSAEPRVLPFPECPAAARAVGDLVGCDLSALSTSVPELLTGIRSCTHLNDLLRALGGVAALVAHGET